MIVKIRIFDEYIESTYETVVNIVDDYAKKVFFELLARNSFPSIFRSSYMIKDGFLFKISVANMDDPKVGLGSVGFGQIEILAPNHDIYGPIKVTIYVGDSDYVDYWKGLMGLLRCGIEPLVELHPKLKTYSIEDKPWNHIEDKRYDRLLLELWWKDFPVSRIARQLNITEGTVRNKLTNLRKEYGEKIVPKRK